jgi:gamma-glutamyl phosphate reductase
VEFSAQELCDVNISNDDIESIHKNVNSLKFLSKEQKKKYFNDIVKSLKSQKLRKILAANEEVV